MYVHTASLHQLTRPSRRNPQLQHCSTSTYKPTQASLLCSSLPSISSSRASPQTRTAVSHFHTHTRTHYLRLFGRLSQLLPGVERQSVFLLSFRDPFRLEHQDPQRCNLGNSLAYKKTFHPVKHRSFREPDTPSGSGVTPKQGRSGREREQGDPRSRGPLSNKRSRRSSPGQFCSSPRFSTSIFSRLTSLDILTHSLHCKARPLVPFSSCLSNRPQRQSQPGNTTDEKEGTLRDWHWKQSSFPFGQGRTREKQSKGWAPGPVRRT